jgi:hypothetical protein
MKAELALDAEIPALGIHIDESEDINDTSIG